MSPAASPGWTIVVPVKPTAVGKSRLAVDGVPREDLARAIALDTISAAAAADLVAEVVVVTDDAEVAMLASGLDRVRSISEGAARGLNAAIAVGLAEAGDTMRAVLLGDLPALRPADLDQALALAGEAPRGAVADAEGTGTTLVTARRGVRLDPAFGEGSFARHRAGGCVALELPDSSTLRRDVDTADDLATAAARGVGPRTSALLRVSA